MLDGLQEVAKKTYTRTMPVAPYKPHAKDSQVIYTRVSRETWEKAARRTHAERITLSALVDRALEAYLAEDD